MFRFNPLAGLIAATCLLLLPILEPAVALGQTALTGERSLSLESELPAGVEALSPARAEEVGILVESAELLRGLEAGVSLPAGRQNRVALERRIDELLLLEVPEGQASAANRLLELFGWIPGRVDLKGQLRGLLIEQVAGYFDTETGFLVIVDPQAAEGDAITVGSASSKGKDPEPSDEEQGMADAILVHEIAHFLQHRHFDLDRFLDQDLLFSDLETAGQALVEGDASHVMFSYLMGDHVERLPDFVENLTTALQDPEGILAMSGGMAGEEALQAAPIFLRDHLMFPYLHGLVFVSRLRSTGGQKLLDFAFAQDPPSSSEQILHPEKWLETRDVPVEIDLPQLDGLLGAPRIWGSWGEYSLQVGLRVRLGAEGTIRARQAAAGWGGDVFALYGDEGSERVAWITEWDSEAEAEEFRGLAEEVFEGWWIGAKGTRVALFFGELEPVFAGSVQRALLGSFSRRPAARAPELSTLGISATDLPVPATPEEAQKILAESPIAASTQDVSEEAWTEVMTHPDTREQVQREAEAYRQMLAQSEAVGFVRQGRRVVAPELGLSLDLPGADWVELDLSEADAAERPDIAYGDGNGAVVTIKVLPMPIPLGLGAMVAGIKMAAPGVEILEQRQLEAMGSTRIGELFYDLPYEDHMIRSLHRFYFLPSQVVSIQTASEPVTWPSVEADMKALLGSVSLAEVP